MNRVVVISGGSSGIGFHTAEALVEQGCKVYDLSRHENPDHRAVHHIPTDVCDNDAVNRAIQQIIATEGRIDILINNAGFGISGAVEFTDPEEVKRLFDVNFFGAFRLTKAVLPYMRKQGSGKIINISSVAAVAPIPFQTFYSASKAAILAYTMSTANELRPFGITVCSVLPGDIRTGFTSARCKNAIGDDVYEGRITRSVLRMERDEQNGMSPIKAGRFIAKIALNRRKKPLYTIGFTYKALTLLIKLLPSGLVNYILKLMYAK